MRRDRKRHGLERGLAALLLAALLLVGAAPAQASGLTSGATEGKETADGSGTEKLSVSGNGAEEGREGRGAVKRSSAYASVSFNGIFDSVTVKTRTGDIWTDVKDLTQDIDLSGSGVTASMVSWNLDSAKVENLASDMKNAMDHGTGTAADYQFTFSIPEGIILDASQDSVIADPGNPGDTANPLARITIHPADRKATLAFTEKLKDYAGISVAQGLGFVIISAWDKDYLKNQGDQEMVFTDGMKTPSTVTIPLKVQPAKAKVSFQKSGEASPDKSKMLWTITADPAKADAEGGKIYVDTTVKEIGLTDTLPRGLNLAAADVAVYQGATLAQAKAAGPLTAGSDYTAVVEEVQAGTAPDVYIAKKATVRITKPIETQGDEKYFIVLTTAVDPSAAVMSVYKDGADKAGLQYSFNNSASPEYVKYEEKTGEKTGDPVNNALVKDSDIIFGEPDKVGSGPVAVKSAMLTKQSARAGDVIAWTLTVNETGMDIGETVLTDAIDAVSLNSPVKITYTKGSGAPAELSIGATDANISELSLGAESADHHRSLKIKIADCKEKYVIRYETSIKDRLDAGRGIQNNAVLSAASFPEPMKVTKTQNAGSVIRKEAVEDQPNGVLQYTVYLNENYARITHPKISDYIPAKLRLIDDGTLAAMTPVVSGDKRIYILTGNEIVKDGSGPADKCVVVTRTGGYGVPVTPAITYTVDTSRPEGDDQRYLLEIEFGNSLTTIEDAYTIVLRPRVIADEIWMANKVKKPSQADADLSQEFRIANTAVLEADNGAPTQERLRRSTVNTDLNHNVIRKAYVGNSYNAAEHSFQWKITVNGDNEGSYKDTKVQLKNPVVTETVTPTQSFLIGGAVHKVMLKAGSAPAYEITASNGGKGYYEIDPLNSRAMRIHLPHSSGKSYLNEKCEITLYSKINDADIVKPENLTAAGVSYENQAVLAYDGSNVVPAERLRADAQALVPPDIFDKTYQNAPAGNEVDNKQLMEWTVVLNKNGFQMIRPAVEDELPSGLYLDASSIKLYEGLSALPGAMMTKGSDFTYKCETQEKNGDVFQKLTVNLKRDITGPCLMTYTTYVIPNESNECPETVFRNTVRMTGGSGSDFAESGNAKIAFYRGTAWGSFKSNALGSVTVTKKDAGDGSKLGGAKFLLENRDKSYSATLVTDNTGKAFFDNLPLNDVYTVTEVAAPAGYKIDDTTGKTAPLDAAAKTKNLEFADTMLKEAVVIVKKDAETKELLSGAEFTFQSPGKNSVKAYTGADGKLVQPLPAGDWTVEETKAPAGYEKSAQIKNVSIVTGAAVQTLTFENISKKGALTIYKKDKLSGAGLSGAEFEIRKDGASGLTFRAVTDGQGKASVTLPAAGSYTVTETGAPEYYLADSPSQNVAPDTANSTFPSLVFTDTRITGSLILKKEDRLTGEPLAGTAFRVLKDDNSFTLDVTTASDGTAEAKGLPIPGSYTVTEITPPAYYNNDSVPWKISLSSADIVNGAAVRKNVFTNTRMDPYNQSRLILTKQDSSNAAPLEGAVFAFSSSGRNPIESVTAKDGTIDLYLPAGDWEIRELQAPNGYRITGGGVQNIRLYRDQETRLTVKNEKEKTEEKTQFHGTVGEDSNPGAGKQTTPAYLSLSRAVSAAKTGDYAPLAALTALSVALLLAAAGCAVLLIRRRKKQ